jgi:hypothetical protein
MRCPQNHRRPRRQLPLSGYLKRDSKARECRNAARPLLALKASSRCRASLVYLPPYSPDLNPIELAFARLKALLRKIAALTISALSDAVGDIVARFTPRECANLSRQRWIWSSQTVTSRRQAGRPRGGPSNRGQMSSGLPYYCHIMTKVWPQR